MFRQRCIIIQASPVLDSLLNLIIILHTYFLGLVDFRDHTSPVNQRLSSVLSLFSVIYLLEIGIKVIARGFYQGHNTFIKDPYNLLDFLALVTFVLGWSIPAFRYFEVIKAYRLIKLLRLFGWTDLDLLVKVITNSF